MSINKHFKDEGLVLQSLNLKSPLNTSLPLAPNIFLYTECIMLTCECLEAVQFKHICLQHFDTWAADLRRQLWPDGK